MARAKASELRGKSKEDLTKQLQEFKQELNNLRVAKVGPLFVFLEKVYKNIFIRYPVLALLPSLAASRKFASRSVAP